MKRGRTIVSTSIVFVLAIAAGAHTARAQLVATFHLNPNPKTLACAGFTLGDPGHEALSGGL